MKPKVNEYILINNNIEWLETQKYLFNLGYKWCNNTQNIIPKDNFPYPDYILIETNHKNKNDNFMFSYAQIPYHNSIIHSAHKILKEIRKEKLKKLCQTKNL